MAELLIVVAIIAVLVAIAIPLFTTQLEKPREATDLANIRAAYAEVITSAIMEPGDEFEGDVNLVQIQDDWQTSSAQSTLEKLGAVDGTPTSKGQCKVKWEPGNTALTGDNKLTFYFDGEGGSGSGDGDDGNGGNNQRYSSRMEFMKAVANGLKKGFAELIPDGKMGQALSCLHTDAYTAQNGDYVSVTELSITESNMNAGVYWNPSKYTWGELINEAGVSLDQLGDQKGYVYFDDDINPVSISYYDEDGKNFYTFLDSINTYVMDKMPGERQHAAYYEDYAKGLGTLVN